MSKSEPMAVELNETDKAILRTLAEGRATPSYLERQTDYTRQAIQGRLTVLRAGDYVERIDTGLYEITGKGSEVVEGSRE